MKQRTLNVLVLAIVLIGAPVSWVVLYTYEFSKPAIRVRLIVPSENRKRLPIRLTDETLSARSVTFDCAKGYCEIPRQLIHGEWMSIDAVETITGKRLRIIEDSNIEPLVVAFRGLRNGPNGLFFVIGTGEDLLKWP